jgi:tetratricopeptide (TPR) repeat protein
VVAANRDAAAAMSRGDVDRAIDDLTKAVQADPQDAMALNNLGQALVRAGRARDAIQYFDRAIELSDATWAYRFNRTKAYEALKQWGPAIADYRAAEQLFPDDYATVFNLARALEADGSLPQAIDAFTRAITLAPGEADFRLAQGHALEEAGRVKEAAAAYRAYLDLEPNGRDADKIKARIAQLEGTPPPPGGAANAAVAAGTLAADRR